jgi:arylsulfatase
MVLLLLLALAWHFTAGPAQANDARSAPRPNVLLILSDDLGYSDLGCYGGEIRTPHLDSVAADGLRFTQFYNCGVCYPTRLSLMTGLYPQGRAGGFGGGHMVTLGEVMRRAGYQTALSGKWHLGTGPTQHPNARGFPEFYGLLSGCCNYFDPSRRDPPFEGSGFRPFAHNRQRTHEFPDDFYTTDAFSRHAVEQIHRFARTDAPFFLAVCYTAPHFPLHAPPDDIARYKGRYDMGYFELRRQRHARQIELGLVDPRWRLAPVDPKAGPWRHDWAIPAWDDVENTARETRLMEVYAAMVDRMDQGIGRILAALEETGAATDTLVLFFSDNGGCATDWPDKGAGSPHRTEMPGDVDTYSACGPGWGWAQNTPFRRYKIWAHEGGIATPLIVRWPGVTPRGQLTTQVGHVMDIMPTLVELAGTEYPQAIDGRPIIPVEGKSLVPIFHGRQREPHEVLCWSIGNNRAIRQGKWKLVWGHTTQRWELYDMELDRTETNDLSPTHPHRVQFMREAWQRWDKETGRYD